MSLGKDLSIMQQDDLERLVDACGLCAVLQGLSIMCEEKADHIIASYPESKSLARKWRTASGAIAVAACNNSVLEIGKP